MGSLERQGDRGSGPGSISAMCSPTLLRPSHLSPVITRQARWLTLSFPPQMQDLGVAPGAPATQGTVPTFAFTSAFQRRAGGVLVASDLQGFLERALRILRYLSEP